jgi:hypothetical protein
VVPDHDGEAIWTGGGRSQIRVGDLARSREGSLDGDPTAVFLEPPFYGGEGLPGWEELFHWLGQVGASALGALLIGTIRSGYERWRSRGAGNAICLPRSRRFEKGVGQGRARPTPPDFG